jgi:uncharacterized protein (DUF885 family)
MKRTNLLAAALSLLFAFVGCAPEEEKHQPATGTSTSYEDLVALFEDWRDFQKPQVTDGVPDYTRAAMEQQHRELGQYQARLAAIDSSGWLVAQQVDYHIVRAEMNGLDFDHRVLHPWARDPCFYVSIRTSPTDVPAREGPDIYGTLRLWEYTFPLSGEKLTEFRTKLQAIPKLLEQGKGNLIEEAKDLWFLGMRLKDQESVALAELAKTLAEHHSDLVPDAARAKEAVDAFRGWLEGKQANMTAPSGIGIDNYNWYMKNVHLLPYTWEDQLAILERELHRSWAHLNLEEARNRALPALEPPATREEMRRRFHDAVDEFMAFLRENEVNMPEYMNDTLRDHGGRFIPPPGPRDIFAQVDHHDSLPMRTHGMHWFDLARMDREPHPSPIRRVPLLYNIWDSRAEGLATGMEEMAMHAGLFDKRPRARELIYILLAARCARGMGDLRMHSNEFTLEEAMKYAVEWTPRGWFLEDGRTVWFDERLYLEQPGYGTSYVIGKVHIEKLLADRAKQLGQEFKFGQFMDELHAAGMIPTSLIRWEMTGLTDEIEDLW